MDEEATRKAEENIEIWKIKKLVKSLEAARGCVALPRQPHVDLPA